jgi:hypothetical protein
MLYLTRSRITTICSSVKNTGYSRQPVVFWQLQVTQMSSEDTRSIFFPLITQWYYQRRVGEFSRVVWFRVKLCVALILQIAIGKTNGLRTLYGRVIPHRNVFLCPLGALALYLIGTSPIWRVLDNHYRITQIVEIYTFLLIIFLLFEYSSFFGFFSLQVMRKSLKECRCSFFIQKRVFSWYLAVNLRWKGGFWVWSFFQI